MNRLRLILSDTDANAPARDVWQKACDDAGYALEILLASDAAARELSERLSLNLYPALLQGDRIIAVGSPDRDTAQRILADLANDAEEKA